MAMTGAERDYYNDIRQINRKTRDQNQPDWEQRRYEIVKEIAVRWLTHPIDEVRTETSLHSENVIEGAINFANTLIDGLIMENLKHPL